MVRILFAFRGKYGSRKNRQKKSEGELLIKMLDHLVLTTFVDKVSAFSFLPQSKMPDGLDFMCRLFEFK